MGIAKIISEAHLSFSLDSWAQYMTRMVQKETKRVFSKKLKKHFMGYSSFHP